MLFHPIWAVLLVYFAATYVEGFTMAIVFQLAHCVEEANFPPPPTESARIDIAWAEHQVETTVDFARHNPIVSWFTGGLNFQVEHHLFPRVCHIHYPALAGVVEETCRDFGLRYTENRTFRRALASHFRWLKRMGAAEERQETGDRERQQSTVESDEANGCAVPTADVGMQAVACEQQTEG